ncbi:MAG TPA: hypothetical protein GX017_00500 [Clostridiales bacterium]|nr:hypothetical protein [Clostridiales bacterium]
MRVKRRQQRTAISAIPVIIAAALLMFTSSIAYAIFRPRVVSTVTIEVGSPMVDVSEFLRDKNESGRFKSNIDQLNLKIPGAHEIEIIIGEKTYTSQLVVQDSVAPVGVPVDVLILKGDEIQADAFVKDIFDATDVSVSFKRRVSTKVPGNHTVGIELSDTSGNHTTLYATLTVLDVKESIQVEAGSTLSLTTYDFADHGNWPVSFITNLNALDCSKPAQHVIHLDINGRRVSSVIDVVDTTPPAATLSDQEIYLGQSIQADAFVSDIDDVSHVNCSFLKAPNFTRKGTTEVTIILEDAYGNKSQYKAKLLIKPDTDPPEFFGIQDIIIFEGQAVSYRKNVTAIDGKDGEVDFQVNSSNVNPKKPGEYEVIYTAVDEAGNEAMEKAIVTVKKMEVSEEAVNSLADEILDNITKPGMTKREIAYEIFKYVKGSIAYTGTSDKTSVVKEAFRGIKSKVGDCFTYYALSEVMLTRAGIENMRVTRVGGKTQHYWNLINCGDGWYHFDAALNNDGAETFMLTDAEMEELTRKRGRNYYVFDKDQYPATPLN